MAGHEGSTTSRHNRLTRRLSAVALSLTLGGLASLAWAPPASAASQSIPGVIGTVTPTLSQLCTSSTMQYGSLYYTESEIPGREIGGSYSAGRGKCLQKNPITSKSRFRSFHVCNSNGVCGPEIYL
ncbi:hypothetical protein ABT352_13455 [Streptosporangium sp. NPDC000563]|uniref:hypothetical protein n=1 Tax=Streptosporangium sp. NPDC000563 TaxID=3154366 RepID=UPI0033278F71